MLPLEEIEFHANGERVGAEEPAIEGVVPVSGDPAIFELAETDDGLGEAGRFRGKGGTGKGLFEVDPGPGIP